MEDLTKSLDYSNVVIAGCDEVGRGSLVNGMCACCFASVGGFCNDMFWLKDSKMFAKREDRAKAALKIYQSLIQYKNLVFEMATVSLDEIETLGIQQANILVLSRAVNQVIQRLGKIDVLYVDWFDLPVSVGKQISEAKADSKYIHVMAASILAKVYRDNQLSQLSFLYPVYGWETNAGYGTKQHYEAIHKYGITQHHRKSFLKEVLNNEKISREAN